MSLTTESLRSLVLTEKAVTNCDTVVCTGNCLKTAQRFSFGKWSELYNCKMDSDFLLSYFMLLYICKKKNIHVLQAVCDLCQEVTDSWQERDSLRVAVVRYETEWLKPAYCKSGGPQWPDIPKKS